MQGVRFFLHLSYRGRDFCGWQVQPGQKTIQGELERALSVLFKKEIKVIGAGRTDTGVHAYSYYAHFDLDEEHWMKMVQDNSGATITIGAAAATANENGVLGLLYAQWTYKVNAIVGPEIMVYHIFKVPEDLHARFSAIERTYHYYFHLKKDPFINDYSYFVRTAISLPDMEKGAARLKGHHDFTSFEKVHTQVNTHECDLRLAEIHKIGDGRYKFVFSADRFLRNMVRSMVGSLLDIGEGKYKPEHITEILEAKNRNSAGASVPAQGLFLYEIKYF